MVSRPLTTGELSQLIEAWWMEIEDGDRAQKVAAAKKAKVGYFLHDSKFQLVAAMKLYRQHLRPNHKG